jgi:hypothetical protein
MLPNVQNVPTFRHNAAFFELVLIEGYDPNAVTAEGAASGGPGLSMSPSGSPSLTPQTR